MKADDEQGYVEYVTSRLPWIRKVAFLLCQDWHRADDVCQTAITRLYVHWRRVSAAENVDAYMRTIVVRAFLADRRSVWAKRVELRSDAPEEAQHTDDDLPARIAVRRALAEVAPRQRAVLVLRFYLDLSVEETAQALACSTGTVMGR